VQLFIIRGGIYPIAPPGYAVAGRTVEGKTCPGNKRTIQVLIVRRLELNLSKN